MTEKEVKKGDTVKVHYTGTLDDGKMFDSSEGKDPIEFKVGDGLVIKGFDKGVEGMKQGEEKEIHIECKDAYGEPNEELKKEVPKSSFPDNVELKIGMVLVVQGPNGQQMPVRVVDIKGDKVTVDFNHPLAGKDLNFKVKVEEIKS